ncbi:hypothetical protein ACQ3I4_05075 [Zafaria sp. Z1313]|uniref:hypothetical protein n=1 Tax=unclassified Zafaria TaxID=2828765 RepID=UPI002E75E8ED|nr:hypothetical protein [Zafaria sp. J156]MEE1621377.1 hypothetical protein [Zafaria sp. J156]
MSTPDPTPSPDGPAHDDGRIEVEVRSAPRFWPFLGAGAALGILAALVSAYTGEESAEFTRAAVAGFLAVLFGLAGVLVGALAYLAVDRILRQRARHGTAVPVEPDDAA